MKKNKTILHLCEIVLGTLMVILILDLYLAKTLRNPAVSYTPAYHCLQISLILLIFTIVLALIQREMLSRLLINAFRDITGVHNKKSLEKKIQELNERPDTFDIGVMMFDLNNLKYVNDTYGHEKGDEFIQAFTYCLTRILNENSFLARYGGDEFIIIQKDTTPDALCQTEQKLNSLVLEYNSHSSLQLSYAVGYEVSYRNHYFMMEDLINAADKKMYQDKARKKQLAQKQGNRQLSRNESAIPNISSETLFEKIRQFQKNSGNRRQLVMISTDIENFHYINDKYGYSMGNEILNIVHEELSSASFSLYTARFFSDVFISLGDTDALESETLTEQLQQLDQKISHRVQDTFPVSFFRTNSGICFIPEDPSPEVTLAHANIARRISKKMLSHVCIYSDEIEQQEKMQAEILHSFHEALENEEFQIYFQPKVTPETGLPCSAEVLVRWIRNGKTLWSPAVYIPLFEQNGFIVDLDYFVYQKTFEWIQKFESSLPDTFRISLNVSPVHFEQPQIFIEKIQELIKTYQITPSHLTFEITESAYVNNTEAVNQVIRCLQRQNIQISMDDFGSGYSSLNTLKDLLFDEVKIDRKFLGDSLNEKAQIVLEEIFHMLKRMNKSIVCEGVETENIAEFLRKEGCNEIQGFLYYRPMCQKDFEKLMCQPGTE